MCFEAGEPVSMHWQNTDCIELMAVACDAVATLGHALDAADPQARS